MSLAPVEPAADAPGSLTSGLVSLIRAKPIEETDLEAAALFTLDAIANTLAGRNSDPGRALLEWAQDFGGTDPGRRAFLLGALTHILETDDLHRASVVHPGCVVVPAVLAIAETRAVDGESALRAILHGFEATCRVGMAVGPAHYKIWHNTATCGVYGSAMPAATLYGLSDAEAVHALGNAGTQSAGLWEFLETGAMSKHLHAGRGAEAGLVAASLARHGFTGPPTILEGDKGLFAGACPDPDPGAVLRDPQARWQLHDTSIKPWPSCRHTHPAVDAALSLSGAVPADRISEVVVETYQAAVDVCDRPVPDSVYAAKFSLQHCVAAALADGAVGFDSFEAAARARLGGLRQMVRLQVAEPYRSAYPQAWGSAVSVQLTDGSSRSASRSVCKGDPDAALGREEMIDKARMLLAHGGLSAGESDDLIATVLAAPKGNELPSVTRWVPRP